MEILPKFFDDQYTAGSQVATLSKEETVSAETTRGVTAEVPIVVEQEKYGTGKPKRIVIRGKITRDKN